ncbi:MULTISPECIES: hypothetical protein [Pseudoxanthomonas]|uniref:Uncharacterized protein n=1 Tax=Pseudoxanthomonas winnipegensis TaxID=2480810 RepID=A0AAW8GB36_9GAMM|nr:MULTISPECIES: hypothetical protein [Pseudoxanthomonas]MDQ1119646.1 hypothetical protein [Pseudoxanthomonas winnipegensis]MDQ1132841.1 hypothetical protein [Pseudoxanthomonas winnipegensis]MDR6137152.1 hypothetical protein [Pseudoxanthomonas sp. SORGH_AS_0997]
MKIKQWFGSGLIAVAAVLMAPGAWAQTADIFDIDYVQGHLVAGKTTKAQVLESFGEPTSKKAKLSSSGGASETYVYIKGAAKKPAASAGSGFGKMVGSLRGVLGDVSDLTGKNVGGEVASNSYRAQRSANAADRLSARAGTDADTSAGADGASRLTIQIQGGVVTSFDME